eukprot:SAG31_NODE_326_length_17664_cov_10.038543_6_plen_194_part_00
MWTAQPRSSKTRVCSANPKPKSSPPSRRSAHPPPGSRAQLGSPLCWPHTSAAASAHAQYFWRLGVGYKVYAYAGADATAQLVLAGRQGQYEVVTTVRATAYATRQPATHHCPSSFLTFFSSALWVRTDRYANLRDPFDLLPACDRPPRPTIHLSPRLRRAQASAPSPQCFKPSRRRTRCVAPTARGPAALPER